MNKKPEGRIISRGSPKDQKSYNTNDMDKLLAELSHREI